MKTYTAEIRVGGPANGFPFSAYVTCDAPGWTWSDRSAVMGLGTSPEAAATDARNFVGMVAQRGGYCVEFAFPREN